MNSLEVTNHLRFFVMDSRGQNKIFKLQILFKEAMLIS